MHKILLSAVGVVFIATTVFMGGVFRLSPQKALACENPPEHYGLSPTSVCLGVWTQAASILTNLSTVV